MFIRKCSAVVVFEIDHYALEQILISFAASSAAFTRIIQATTEADSRLSTAGRICTRYFGDIVNSANGMYIVQA